MQTALPLALLALVLTVSFPYDNHKIFLLDKQRFYNVSAQNPQQRKILFLQVSHVVIRY